jgi:hypothetical protein
VFTADPRIDLGSIALVSLGIGRCPDIIAHSLTALREAGIAPRLVTTMPGGCPCSWT